MDPRTGSGTGRGPTPFPGGFVLMTQRVLYVAFVVSGTAGLVYEVLWSRYLGLYVGHTAFAQVLVLTVYLGGMALGSLLVADLSKRVARPLVWYALAEGLLALFGLVFHPVFTLATDLAYDSLFPSLASAGLVGAARWAIAGALILPQAIVLGATFPLMAAAIVRLDESAPGKAMARVYLFNTLGGATGVLVAGFWLIGALGLPGTSVAAAGLNAIAAALVIGYLRTNRGSRVDSTDERPAPAPKRPASEPAPAAWARDPRGVLVMMLCVSFGTALASFTYEIGWIRMLSLVLGSATHAFELMLSAFILGLALGAWAIGTRADRTSDPFRLLGIIQVLMGVAAALSIPLFYRVSFDAVARMIEALPDRDAGYALFNLGRYGLCLLVMLPSTILAGMTLPVITGSLLRAGLGEASIGRVYGTNTIGSVAGAVLAGLFAMPILGVKGLVLAAAVLDISLGLWLLQRSSRWAPRGGLLLAASAAAAAVVVVTVQVGARLDQLVLSSGVYRTGEVPGEADRQLLYYADGLTATVSAYIGRGDGVTVLATNGKPDASLEPIWRVEGRDTLPPTPLPVGRDFTTQVLTPIVALAHRPGARSVANIGHGSGMSATSFLTSDALERLVTIEIEPLMVEGSVVFNPTNEPAFSDPRSTYVFDDAKSYFSYQRERFDVILAEPSNPWVSGTASLFTREFYDRVRTFLTPGGVLAQWIQLYELNDDLLMSVIAALDESFPSYRGYLVGDSDVAIVARADGPLDDPDWSPLDSRAFVELTAGIPPIRPEHLSSLLLFDETTFRPLLARGPRVNSDFHPYLDLGAERARFERQSALGVYSFGTSRVDLMRLTQGRLQPPLPYQDVPSYGLGPAVRWGRAAWLREAAARGGGIAPESYSDWQGSLETLQLYLDMARSDQTATTWLNWATLFGSVESELHWGTVGWIDTTFYRVTDAYLDRADAPPVARAAVDFLRALSLTDWPTAAAAADQLVARGANGEEWVPTATLLDGAVLAYLRVDRVEAAREALERLTPFSGREPNDIRNRLLAAMIEDAAGG